MKKILNLTAVIAVITAFALSSCGKYEDGPGLSLASKKGRVVGVWTIEKTIYTPVTGAVVTTDSVWNDYSVEYTKDGAFISTMLFGGVSFSVQGTWAFDGSKENIITTYTSGSVTSTETGKILRLTSKEMWLEDTD
ncbi:MAG: hypothetical protein V2A54_01085, partial [Bacteroidota bacterium]